MLELKELYKTFNPGTINAKTALSGLSVTLNDGDFVTVIGGNGAGKSTMLNATAGTFFVDSGKVLIDGKDIFAMDERKLTVFRRSLKLSGLLERERALLQMLRQGNILPERRERGALSARVGRFLSAALERCERRGDAPAQRVDLCKERVALRRDLAAEAVRVLEQLWVEGYTVAAHQLGKFYRDDLSTMRDHEKAERWFRLSAEAGNDFSEYALGKLLLSQKRTEEAVRWLDKAAGHGNPFAQYRLGKLFLTGESVKKDVRKALEYLTAAARQGNPFAQYTLGKLYLLGRDVEQDREQARDWFTRSAAQGNAYAQFFLDRFDQFRDPSVMLAATKLLHHMSRIFRDNSMPPRNPAGIRIDSKRRKRLTEKRMAMGHKADDHEEQVSYQQTM